jgi:deoxyhypusine synthase
LFDRFNRSDVLFALHRGRQVLDLFADIFATAKLDFVSTTTGAVIVGVGGHFCFPVFVCRSA